MYKVFVNDIPIILSTEEDLGEKYTSLPIKDIEFKELIKKISNGELLFVNLYHKKEEKLLKYLRKKLPVVIAAGGLVYNDAGEVLFIHRKGRWDLPKGKVEKKESLEAAALREVEEETGVKDLKIKKYLQETYHTFQRGGKYKLKITHWYEMYSNYTGILKPEVKEGIKKVKWKNEDKASKALSKSYGNIKLLFPDQRLSQDPKNRIS